MLIRGEPVWLRALLAGMPCIAFWFGGGTCDWSGKNYILKMVKLCVVCDKNAELACPVCNQVWYCTSAHVKEHAPSHASQCQPFQVNVSLEYGRYLVKPPSLSPSPPLPNQCPVLTFKTRPSTKLTAMSHTLTVDEASLRIHRAYPFIAPFFTIRSALWMYIRQFLLIKLFSAMIYCPMGLLIFIFLDINLRSVWIILRTRLAAFKSSSG